MKKKNISRKNGNFLLEFLICMFIFSILILGLTVYTKRVKIIEDIKIKSYSKTEEIDLVVDRILYEISNRDKDGMEISDNIMVEKEHIIYKNDGTYYKIEYNKEEGDMLVSSGKDINRLGKQVKLSDEKLSFERKNNLLILSIKLENKNIVRILCLD